MLQWTADFKGRWIEDWCRHDMIELIAISGQKMEEDDQRLISHMDHCQVTNDQHVRQNYMSIIRRQPFML